jgi:hypothetical protein
MIPGVSFDVVPGMQSGSVSTRRNKKGEDKLITLTLKEWR